MNDEHFCCNGQCKQGRECPRYQEDKPMSWGEKLTLFIGLLGWVLFICLILGYAQGTWRLV